MISSQRIAPIRIAILLLACILPPSSLPGFAQLIDVKTLSIEELIALQYRDDASAELKARIAELPYPEQEAVHELKRDYVPERNFPDDYNDADLMAIYLSQPGINASEVTIRTLIERTDRYSDTETLRHRTALENQLRSLDYPEATDTSESANYKRAEYLLVEATPIFRQLAVKNK